MPSSFKVGDNNQIVRQHQAGYAGGLRMIKSTGGSYFLACCGMAGVEQFGYPPGCQSWAEKADYLSHIYRYLYSQGTVIYALSDTQLNNEIHKMFLEIGAEKISEFPNLYHRPNMIHLFRVNIRRACGRFCNMYGEPYAEPPKDDSEVDPKEDEAKESYAYLPKRQ